MKITLTQNVADISGVPNYVGQLANGLQKRGHEVWVVAPDGPSVERYRSSGINVHLSAPRHNIDWRYTASLKEWLIAHGIEVLHANMLKTSVNGLAASWLAKTPVRVAHIHGTLIDWEVPWWKKLPNVAVNSLITNACATDVVALTPSIGDQLVRQEHIRRSLIRVIPNGVELPKRALDRTLLRRQLGIDASVPVIGTFSRLTVEKGLAIVLEALSMVWQKFPDLHLVIIGDGQDRAMLENKASKLERSNQVHFLGFQPEDIKPDLLAGMDAYIFPSTREGFGISMLEAISAKVPVVASDLPVLRDIVTDGQTGLLFAAGNPKALVARIIDALELPQPEKMAMTSRAYDMLVQRYSVDRFVDAYESMYRHSLDVHS